MYMRGLNLPALGPARLVIANQHVPSDRSPAHLVAGALTCQLGHLISRGRPRGVDFAVSDRRKTRGQALVAPLPLVL
jgi:hypothetical protein